MTRTSVHGIITRILRIIFYAYVHDPCTGSIFQRGKKVRVVLEYLRTNPPFSCKIFALVRGRTWKLFFFRSIFVYSGNFPLDIRSTCPILYTWNLCACDAHGQSRLVHVHKGRQRAEVPPLMAHADGVKSPCMHTFQVNSLTNSKNKQIALHTFQVDDDAAVDEFKE